MALSTPVTLTATATGAASTLTSASYTPTANGLQIVVISGTGSINGQTLSSVSSTHSGTGSWNFVGWTPSASSKVSVYIAWAVTGASPGSGTFTATFVSTTTDNQLTVCEITGQDTTTPVDSSQGASNPLGDATTSTTPSLTLNTSPTTNDVTFGAFASRNLGGSDISAGAGFTALVQNHHANPSATQMLEYRASSTSTTVAASGMGSVANAGVAIIVKAAAGGTPGTVSGALSSTTIAAPAGAVSGPANIAGAKPNVAIAAPAGTVGGPANIAGVKPNITIAAPAGTVSAPVNIAGPVATLVIGALAGTVSGGSSSPGSVTGVVAPVVIAAPAGSVAGPANLGGALSTLTLTALAGSVDVVAPPATLYHFETPTRRPEVAGSDIFWKKLLLQRSTSILKNGSFYTEIDYPSAEQVDAADITYLGGRIYTVTQTEADALTAAGYGAGLTPIT